MAKNMARIENGIVVNVEWCSDDVPDTDELVSFRDILVEAGDSFKDGSFYRDGKKLMSPTEEALLEAEDMREALAILEVELNG